MARFGIVSLGSNEFKPPRGVELRERDERPVEIFRDLIYRFGKKICWPPKQKMKAND